MLQTMGSQGVGYALATEQQIHQLELYVNMDNRSYHLYLF